MRKVLCALAAVVMLVGGAAGCGKRCTTEASNGSAILICQ